MFAILKGHDDGFVNWLGVQCASWISTSRGTTGRSPANPEGDPGTEGVRVANYLACRPRESKPI